MRAFMFLVPSALVACDVAMPGQEPDVDGVVSAIDVGPQFDLELTQGFTAEQHVQVAEGVFMRQDLYASGEVQFFEAEPLTAEELELQAHSGGGPDYCYEYDYENNSDSTANGTLFGGNTRWYSYAIAGSYDYDYPGYSYDRDYVSTYVYTYAPNTVDYVYSYGYVYVNGTYAGYVYQYNRNARYAYAYGSWAADCDGGDLEVDVIVRHYVYDTPPLGFNRYEYLSVGDYLSASIQCCD